MRKVTGGLIVLAFLLCAFSAQAASGLDVSIPSAGEPCSSSLDCTPGEVCIYEICSVPTPCSSSLDCGPGEVCIDEICAEGECTENADCPDEEVCDVDEALCVECTEDADCPDEEVCKVSNNQCVECTEDADCGDNAFCRLEINQCEDFEDCNLRIRPRKIKIRNKKGKPLKRYLATPFVVNRIKVTGNKNFKPIKIAKDEDWAVPPGLGLGNSSAGLKYEAKKRSLAILLYALTTETEPGTYQIRFGNCRGDVKLY